MNIFFSLVNYKFILFKKLKQLYFLFIQLWYQLKIKKCY